MTNEKANNHVAENKECASLFKNGILTKEDYTKVWIELISVSESGKRANYLRCQ